MSDGAPPPPRSNRGRVFFGGCALLAAVVVAAPPVGWYVYSQRAERLQAEAERAHEAATDEAFAPALQALSDAAAPDRPYDIDKTVRVIHEIDHAIESSETLGDYLKWSARQDYSDVAPEVLEKRRQILDILMRLYAKQEQVEDQEAMWEVTRELLLSTFSVVGLSGEASLTNPAAGVQIDRQQAQQLLAELKSDKAHRRQLVEDIAAIEVELFTALTDYGQVFYKHLAAWDQLSVLRDRAYLAIHNGDYASALAAAELAIERAPGEREAHLLKAMALIELDNRENAGQIRDTLQDVIDAHPDATAPAFVLLGVHQARLGRHDDAQLAFQQAAAYYPKQADRLLDMLDPYERRSFLRKSREGTFIVELYKSTMLGAGYFSPDLQLARTLFDRGDIDAGRAKVLDHFARRRTQQQWDFLVSDIRFCHELLGPHFWSIFPEETYLDLEASPAMMGSSLNVSVANRSETTLRNATLVLAVQFTEMYAGDYVAMPAPQTVPAVPAGKTTSFGSLPIDEVVHDKPKQVGDIVRTRAILITDEAVSWVDSDEFRVAELTALRDERRARAAVATTDAAPPVEHPLARRHPRFQSTVDALIDGVSAAAKLELESKYGADNLVVRLPRQLAILRPIFRLRYDGTLYEATDNLITGEQIELRFKGVENFDADGAEAPGDVELVMASPFGDVVFGWQSNGDLTWRYAGGEREPAP